MISPSSQDMGVDWCKAYLEQAFVELQDCVSSQKLVPRYLHRILDWHMTGASGLYQSQELGSRFVESTDQ